MSRYDRSLPATSTDPLRSPTATTSKFSHSLEIPLDLQSTAPISPIGGSFNIPPPVSDGRRERERERKPPATNPLVDLIDTEHGFVEDLRCIIKKVAAAYSIDNLPPPLLDAHFRSSESLFRLHKNLLASLNAIGPTPSQPKELGDLLMRWVGQLEEPYRKWGKVWCGGGGWEDARGVGDNDRLKTTLTGLDINTPLLKVEGEDEILTMTSLFTLPMSRLLYYQKLYGRLLKTTKEGRSDHKLLLQTTEKLGILVQEFQQAKQRTVWSNDTESRGKITRIPRAQSELDSGPLQDDSHDSVIIWSGDSNQEKLDLEFAFIKGQKSRESKGSDKTESTSRSRNNFVSSGSDFGRLSSDAGRFSADRDRFSSNSSTFTSSLTVPGSDTKVEELERRLDTNATLDIFTMQPKKCKLQMNPPTLQFVRQIRKQGDCIISFSPLSDPSGRQVVYRQGYLFLLTDLFLVCERVTDPQQWSNGVDMSLLFPPLAGKHLRAEIRDGLMDHELDIVVMRKERLRVEFKNPDGRDMRNERDEWARAFDDCTRFTTVNNTLSPPSSPGFPMSPAPGTTSFFPPSPDPSRSASRSPMSDSSERLSPAGRPIRMASGGIDPGNLPPLPPSPNPSAVGFDRSAQPQFSSNASGDGFPQRPPYPPTNQAYGPARPYQNGGGLPPRPSLPGQGYGLPPRPGQGYAPPPGPPGAPYGQIPLPPIPPEQQQWGNQGMLRKSTSSHSLRSNQSSNNYYNGPPGGYPNGPGPVNRTKSADPYARGGPGSLNGSTKDSRANSLPNGTSRMMSSNSNSSRGTRSRKNSNRYANNDDYDSPPGSPTEDTRPVTSTLAAQMRCKVFFQQGFQQWKSLGAANLKLYLRSPTNEKQLVVENDKAVMISTIVLTDGVERVGKVGVAVELSDKGARTGIIYMLQMKSESSASGLYEQLLLGSDRTG